MNVFIGKWPVYLADPSWLWVGRSWVRSGKRRRNPLPGGAMRWRWREPCRCSSLGWSAAASQTNDKPQRKRSLWRIMCENPLYYTWADCGLDDSNIPKIRWNKAQWKLVTAFKMTCQQYRLSATCRQGDRFIRLFGSLRNKGLISVPVWILSQWGGNRHNAILSPRHHRHLCTVRVLSVGLTDDSN